MSLFTLGTMRALGSVDQMHTVLQAAVLAGINHLETAPAYGPAEEFLGQALQREGPQPDGGWVITSKLLPGLSLSEGKYQLLKILERLGCRNSTTWPSTASTGRSISPGPSRGTAKTCSTGPGRGSCRSGGVQ